MKLSAYLSPSRHGIYYFRWQLPRVDTDCRRYIRLSLRTRCSVRAGTLARYLASCAEMTRGNKALARLRQDEIRSLVQRYFRASLDDYMEKLNDTGFPPQAFDAMRQEMIIHEDAGDREDALSDVYLDNGTLCEAVGLTRADWDENALPLRREMRRGRRDMLTRILEAAERLKHYSFTEAAPIAPTPVAPALPASAPLGKAIEEFISEHSRQWAAKTTKQNQAYLSILLEYFGPGILMGAITKQDASDVKKVLQALPSSRNTKPALKRLPLREVVKLAGHAKIAPKTINAHIQMFSSFFDWAERHGRTQTKLFEDMKVPKAKNAATQRRPFTPRQTKQIFTELVQNISGLVRNDSHKWGTLLGLFTGARLNEICQLEIADVQQEDGIWLIHITDEGDNNKSVKASASRRKVPLHSELIRAGFLDFVQERSGSKRLFPDYSYNSNGGYGRNLGRWVNETFLPRLGIKEPGLVFHCFRHTVVNRLAQADVPEPVYQCIVGHARQGVTQEVYNKGGYKITQLRDAIEKLNV